MQGGAELIYKLDADIENVAKTTLELLDSEPIAPANTNAFAILTLRA